jgi:hypothetical protein
MIYIIFILAALFLIIFAIVQYLYFIKTYYTNSAIIKLRNLEHEAVLYLSENIKGLSVVEAETLRNFISMVTASISMINSLGSMNFKIVKGVVVVIIALVNQIRKVEKKAIPGNIKLEYFSKKYWSALSESMEAIPFLRARSIYLIIKFISGVLVSIGVDKCKKYIKGLDVFISVREDMKHHCLG